MTTRRPSWALWFQLSFTSSDSSWTRVSMSVQNPLIYFPFCGSSSSKGSLAIIKTRQLCDYTTQTEISPLMAALKEEASKSGGWTDTAKYLADRHLHLPKSILLATGKASLEITTPRSPNWGKSHGLLLPITTRGLFPTLPTPPGCLSIIFAPKVTPLSLPSSLL